MRNFTEFYKSKKINKQTMDTNMINSVISWVTIIFNTVRSLDKHHVYFSTIFSQIHITFQIIETNACVKNLKKNI